MIGTTLLAIAVLAVLWFVTRSQDIVPAQVDEAESEQQAAQPQSPADSSLCPQRREWRTLSSAGKESYITAVQCLLEKPSGLSAALNPHNSSSSSLYTDFPFIHSRAGYKTHHVAPFLPWHRYFLNIYHRALREECGYQGELVYWDWTLDSKNLTAAPVFATEGFDGFGGNGDSSSPVVVGKTGRCVTTGPFAGKVEALYYDVTPNRHCLARGFRDDEGGLGQIGNSEELAPENMEKILSLSTYSEFVFALESKVHDVIPFGVAGDFETFTAPYDPLFFLHHVQLDRLWWIWQSRGKGDERWEEYDGHTARHSIVQASLEDPLDMRGWAESIQIKRVMRTQPKEDDSVDLLCYRY